MNASGSRDSLFERFLETALRVPDNPAIVLGETAVTFAELARRAASFAAELAEAGVRPRDRVVVVLPNGPEFIVAVFAIWKLGATLTPLHAQLRQGELAGYITDCDARAIVTTETLRGTVESLFEQARGSLEHAWFWTKGGPSFAYCRSPHAAASMTAGAFVAPQLDGRWPALTQYSTGSTGRPKRITRTHGQVLGELEALSAVLGRYETDRVLGVAPFFHSYGLTAAVGSLLAGARVFAVEEFFPRDVALLVERESLTTFHGVPFMFQTLAELRESASLSSLRFALSSGVPLPDHIATAFKTRYGVSVRQQYGSTEAGAVSVERGEPDEEQERSVGLPYPGVAVRIVNEQGVPVPPGEKGRVEVTSPYAALGYDRSEEQTEAHFVGDRFFPGDLGYLLPGSGRLVIAGRDRGFINVGGNKADPTEVENVLLEMPAIAEAVVLGVPDDSGGEKIKAVLVTSTSCGRVEVLAHCAKRLAPFKVPRIIEFRDELPRNMTGKILRKYLL
jgi:long-chain acyl-CoA synthetase